MLLLFTTERDGRLFIRDGCVFREDRLRAFFKVAHDSKVGGHFGLAKTMSRLYNFRWRHMLRDVRNNVKVCMRCQKFKYSCQMSLNTPHPLEMPHRLWGSVGEVLLHIYRKPRMGMTVVPHEWTDYLGEYSSYLQDHLIKLLMLQHHFMEMFASFMDYRMKLSRIEIRSSRRSFGVR
jgi:Integrase zinc binding domain